jgi:multicomponent Na+:H+ antiporter subunit D
VNEVGSLGLDFTTLLIGTLLATALATYLLRQWEQAAAALGAIVTGSWAIWLWRVDLNEPIWTLPVLNRTIDIVEPLERAGFSFRLQPEILPILAVSLGLIAVGLLLAVGISQEPNFAPFVLVLAAGYSLLYLMTTGPLAPPLLAPLFLVAFSAVGVYALQAGRAESMAGSLRSLIPPVLAFPFFLLAAWYVEQMPLNPQDRSTAFAAGQLISLGLLILLAPVPLHGAQPPLSQFSPPVTNAVLTLLYQLAVLHVLFETLTTFPFVPLEAPLGAWLTWIGLVTAVWGGIAAAGDSQPGRLWGHAALHDWGLILLVLAVPTLRSWSLVLFLFGLRTISMLTAATGLSVLAHYAGSMRISAMQGAGARLPWSSAAFLLGGLGLAGFPLSAGFTGHWASLQLVAETDWRPAAAILLASGGAVFGFVRLARALFGPLANRYILREQPVAVTLAVVVLLLSVSVAVAPQLLDAAVTHTLVAFTR